MEKTIWVLGSSNVDFTYYVDELPLKGETIQAKSCVVATGGKGANQAIAAAHWGVNVNFIGAVGDDEEGSILLDALKMKKIDTSYVSVLPGIKSGNAIIFVNNAGENCITVFPGANMHVPISRLIQNRFGDNDILLAQLEVNVDAVVQCFRIARSCGAFTILNPSPAKEIPQELLTLSDMIVANEVEARIIGGMVVDSIENAIECGKRILANGVKVVVITLGNMGAVLITIEKAIYFPAHPVKAVDTQGAGDIFLGTLAAKLSQGYRLAETIAFANAVASISVTKMGSTQASLPDMDEFNKYGPCAGKAIEYGKNSDELLCERMSVDDGGDRDLRRIV